MLLSYQHRRHDRIVLRLLHRLDRLPHHQRDDPHHFQQRRSRPTRRSLNAMALDCYQSCRAVITVTLIGHEQLGLRADVINYFTLPQHSAIIPTLTTLWLQPIPGDKPERTARAGLSPRPYTQFVNGYSDTVYIDIVSWRLRRNGRERRARLSRRGDAGRAWSVSAPTARVTAYYGCFVIGAFPDGRPGIVSGRLFIFLNGIPTGTQIEQYLGVDCPSLEFALLVFGRSTFAGLRHHLALYSHCIARKRNPLGTSRLHGNAGFRRPRAQAPDRPPSA